MEEGVQYKDSVLSLDESPAKRYHGVLWLSYLYKGNPFTGNSVPYGIGTLIPRVLSHEYARFSQQPLLVSLEVYTGVHRDRRALHLRFPNENGRKLQNVNNHTNLWRCIWSEIHPRWRRCWCTTPCLTAMLHESNPLILNTVTYIDLSSCMTNINGLLARYAKLRVRMRRECREHFPHHRR